MSGRITDPAELQRRAAMVDQKVLEDIERAGWSDMSVFPTDDEPGPYFNYTIGLAEKYDHPDLIVLGMPSHVAHGTLWAAFRSSDGSSS